MRSSQVRHVVHLRVSLIGAGIEINREIVVDRDLTLAQLRPVLQAAFDRPSCRHHLFTNTLEGDRWSRERRRWGDLWTVIDFHDPTVTDEATVRVGRVLSDTGTIYLAHTCDGSWVIEIVAGPDDIVASSEPQARIVGGEGGSPLACARNPFEHDVLVGLLRDESHPDHDAAKICVQAAVGPWSTFAPESFDVGAAQRALEERTSPQGRAMATSSPLDALVNQLPEPARAGLRAHVVAAGIGLPPIVTVEDAARMTRPFARLIECTGAIGAVLVDGQIDPGAFRSDVESLDEDDDTIQRVCATARRLRLVYTRSGRLVAKRTAIEAARSPISLWNEIAQAASSEARGDGTSAETLIFLAIADGTIVDPTVGISAVARAFAIVEGTRRALRSGRGYGYGYGYGSGYGSDEDECDHRCDCPLVDGGTWHYVVAHTIRDAIDSQSKDGAAPVVTGDHLRGLPRADLVPEWLEAPQRLGAPTWLEDEFGPARGRYAGGRARATTRAIDAPDPEADLLSAAAPLIELLGLFGLVRADDGSWTVPPILQEFARAALRG